MGRVTAQRFTLLMLTPLAALGALFIAAVYGPDIDRWVSRRFGR